MNIQLQQSIQNYPQWIKQFQFDPVYGYLIDPNYKPQSFDYDTLYEILADLPNLNDSQQIVDKIRNMGEVQIRKQEANFQDMVILHDCCSYLAHSFIKVLKDQQVFQHDIVLPSNLAIPLAESAGFLRVKTGMATGIGYNWYFINQPNNLDQMTIDNIGIKYLYSKQKFDQQLFFKVSVVTSYFLGQIIKNSYQLNCIITQQPNLIEQSMERLSQIRKYLQKIFQANLNIQLKMNKRFFFYVLRNFVAGYQHIYFQGIEQRVSSSGGAGGYDPSFQCFQRSFGLGFKDEIENVQDKLRHGMPQDNRNLVDFFKENSLIREYCQCDRQLMQGYNLVLQAYAKYLQLHGTFIKNFILDMIPMYSTPEAKYGGNSEGITRIIQKYRFVREQKLEWVN